MTIQRWMLVIPPYGAARSVAFHTADAFSLQFDDAHFKTFDSLTYKAAYNQLLRQPDETMVTDLLNQSLVINTLDFSATHILVCALSPVTLFTLNLLRKQSVTTLHWFYEDYQRAVYWKDVLSGYDHFCAIQKGPLPALCKQYGNRYHFLPTASAGKPHPDNKRYTTCDIAFVGIPTPYRISALESLAVSGCKLAIAGSGWESYTGILDTMIINRTWTDEAQTRTLLSQACIGLNLSCEDPNGHNDVHISPRVFDILAAGCTLLTEDVPLASDVLTECTYFVFQNLTGLCETAHSLLRNKSEQLNSSDNQQIVFQNHSYTNRVNEILAFCAV